MNDDDKLPDELIRTLRNSPSPTPELEHSVIAALRDRGILKRARGPSWTPILLAAAAALVAFLVGERIGEHRATTRASQLFATAPQPTVRRSDFVLWF
jgi:hypothetical protein